VTAAAGSHPILFLQLHVSILSPSAFLASVCQSLSATTAGFHTSFPSSPAMCNACSDSKMAHLFRADGGDRQKIINLFPSSAFLLSVRSLPIYKYVEFHPSFSYLSVQCMAVPMQVLWFTSLTFDDARCSIQSEFLTLSKTHLSPLSIYSLLHTATFLTGQSRNSLSTNPTIMIKTVVTQPVLLDAPFLRCPSTLPVRSNHVCIQKHTKCSRQQQLESELQIL
jgi:hypothetical protein